MPGRVSMKDENGRSGKDEFPIGLLEPVLAYIPQTKRRPSWPPFGLPQSLILHSRRKGKMICAS